MRTSLEPRRRRTRAAAPETKPPELSSARKGVAVEEHFAISPVAAMIAWLILLASAGVFVFVLVAIVSKFFGKELPLPPSMRGSYALMVSGAICSAAYWFLHTYPKHARADRKPGGLPTRDPFERGVSPALLAAGKVAPLFALPTVFLGFRIATGQWTEKTLAPDGTLSLLAGAAVLTTSVFVLFAAPVVWPRAGERLESWSSRGHGAVVGDHSAGRWTGTLRALYPWFAACSGLLGIVMLLGRAREILDSAQRWEVLLCGAAVSGTAGCAFLISKAIQQLEKGEVEEGTATPASAKRSGT